jgi:hypothetical protein
MYAAPLEAPPPPHPHPLLKKKRLCPPQSTKDDGDQQLMIIGDPRRAKRDNTILSRRNKIQKNCSRGSSRHTSARGRSELHVSQPHSCAVTLHQSQIAREKDARSLQSTPKCLGKCLSTRAQNSNISGDKALVRINGSGIKSQRKHCIWHASCAFPAPWLQSDH